MKQFILFFIFSTSIWASDTNERSYEKESPNICGIGVELSLKENCEAILIAGVFDNSEAAKADLKEGDLITAVENSKVSELKTLENAVALIKGPEGSQVTLEVLRKAKTMIKKVTRASYAPPSFNHRYENGELTITLEDYIRKDTTQKLMERVNKLISNKQEISSVKIDLLKSGGGNIEEMISFLKMFAKKGNVYAYIIENDEEKVDIKKASEDGILAHKKLSVTISDDLRAGVTYMFFYLHNFGATIVGTPKNIHPPHITETQHLKNGGVRELTTGRFTGPNGEDLVSAIKDIFK